MRLRALPVALGALCAAGAAVAALTLGSRSRLRPRFSSSSGRPLPAMRPGSCATRVRRRCRRRCGSTASTVLQRRPSCRGSAPVTRFASPASIARRGNAEHHRLLRPSGSDRVVAHGDRRRRSDAARPREDGHDRRFRRRPGAPGVRGAAGSARSQCPGATADRGRSRNRGRVGDRSRRQRCRHRRHLPRGAGCRAGTPRSARGTELATSDIVAGILAAASTGPGVINLSLGSDGVEVADPAGDRDGGAQGHARRRRRGQRRRQGQPSDLPSEPAARSHERGHRRAEPSPRRSRAARASSTSPRRGRTSRSPLLSTAAGRPRTGRASRRRSSLARRRGSGRCAPSSTRVSSSR